MGDVKLFTTPILDGIRIQQYKGFVVAENVRAINIVRDFFTRFRDIFGGRSESYQQVMQQMHTEVAVEIKRRASEMGANAIVGFTIDFDNIGSKSKSLLMAFARGTAVVIEEST